MSLDDINRYIEQVDNKIDNQICNINNKIQEVKQQISSIEALIKKMKIKQSKNNLF